MLSLMTKNAKLFHTCADIHCLSLRSGCEFCSLQKLMIGITWILFANMVVVQSILVERAHLQIANLAKDALNPCRYSGCVSDVGICFNPNQPQRSVSSNCSPSYRSINQQNWSISAKHRLESKHGNVRTVALVLHASRAKVLLHCASTPLVPLHFQLQVRCLLCAFFSTPKCPSLWHVINAMIALHHHSMMLFQNQEASRTFEI